VFLYTKKPDRSDHRPGFRQLEALGSFSERDQADASDSTRDRRYRPQRCREAAPADRRRDASPSAAEECLRALQTQLVLVKRQILEADRRILAWHRSNET
jgi:hypothetical protein